MGEQISIFGLRGAGKTCYIYAMAQVMKGGIKYQDTIISIKANDSDQQKSLNDGYSKLADNEWPSGSKKTTKYDFKVQLQHNDEYHEIVPSLILSDYKGGVLEGDEDTVNSDEENQKETFETLLISFSNSCALIFLIDGITLLNAMEPMDKEPEHRSSDPDETKVRLKARNKISFVENLFWEYKKRNTRIPPTLVAITKSDVFLSSTEIENGKSFIKNCLPSIFAKGTHIDAAITSLSLGENLSMGDNNQLLGKLVLNPPRNIHIPIIYSLYAYLDSVYDKSSKDKQRFIDSVLFTLRRMFEGQVDMYISGKPVFENK